jgi:hypothetical protein
MPTSFMNMRRDGPATSFMGSPTVSAATAAWCSKEPLFPVSSMIFFALIGLLDYISQGNFTLFVFDLHTIHS